MNLNFLYLDISMFQFKLKSDKQMFYEYLIAEVLEYCSFM